MRSIPRLAAGIAAIAAGVLLLASTLALSVEAQTTNGWTVVASGTTVGHRQLQRITPVAATAVRLLIDRSEGEPLAAAAVYAAP